MHQVLSYDTAVHATSSRDYRDNVSKRTCTCLVLTIALFMLISGYLLGNFVTDRKFHARQMLTKNAIKDVENNRAIQLNSADYASLQELRNYQRNKDQLLAGAKGLNKLLQEEGGYLATTSLNAEVFNKYISCTQDIPPNTNIAPSQFIEKLLDNTISSQRDCMRIIQVVMDNHLANSQLYGSNFDQN